MEKHLRNSWKLFGITLMLCCTSLNCLAATIYGQLIVPALVCTAGIRERCTRKGPFTVLKAGSSTEVKIIQKTICPNGSYVQKCGDYTIGYEWIKSASTVSINNTTYNFNLIDNNSNNQYGPSDYFEQMRTFFAGKTTKTTDGTADAATVKNIRNTMLNAYCDPNSVSFTCATCPNNAKIAASSVDTVQKYYKQPLVYDDYTFTQNNTSYTYHDLYDCSSATTRTDSYTCSFSDSSCSATDSINSGSYVCELSNDTNTCSCSPSSGENSSYDSSNQTLSCTKTTDTGCYCIAKNSSNSAAPYYFMGNYSSNECSCGNDSTVPINKGLCLRQEYIDYYYEIASDPNWEFHTIADCYEDEFDDDTGTFVYLPEGASTGSDKCYYGNTVSESNFTTYFMGTEPGSLTVNSSTNSGSGYENSINNIGNATVYETYDGSALNDFGRTTRW